MKRLKKVSFVSSTSHRLPILVLPTSSRHCAYAKQSFFNHSKELSMSFLICQNFQGARNNSNVSIHHLHLTTKYIRFVPVKWESGSCLQFVIHGNVASEFCFMLGLRSLHNISEEFHNIRYSS